MDKNHPLTVYFDASCRLCNKEMQMIKFHDSSQRLIMADCSAADFDDASFRKEGITRTAMMERLHVRDAKGAWIVGVSAFELLYRTVGMNAVAKIWEGRLAKLVYPWVARHRRLISRTGITILFGLWVKYSARRAHQKSRLCRKGQCSIQAKGKHHEIQIFSP